MIVRLYWSCASSLRRVSSPSLKVATQPGLNREYVQEIVRHPGGRVRGRQDAHHLGAGPVIGGNDLVRPDAVGVCAHVEDLEADRAGGIAPDQLPAVPEPYIIMPGAPPDRLLSEAESRGTPFSRNEIVSPTATSFNWVPAASGPEL